MFVTGPKVVRAVTGETIDGEALGGASVHAKISGVAHFLVKSEAEGIETARQILSYFPSNNRKAPPVTETDDPPSRQGDYLRQIVPEQCNKPYEMRNVIHNVLDRGSFLEVQACWAQNIRIGLGRLAGAAGDRRDARSPRHRA